MPISKSCYSRSIAVFCLSFFLASQFLSGCASGSGGNVPLSITSTQLPNAQVGVSYNANLGAMGGTTPYSWALTSGSLPNGLMFSPTGMISGTPTAAAANMPLTFQVQDSGMPQQMKSVNLTLTIGTGSNANVSISPNRGGVVINQSLPLTASVLNDVNNAGVTWSVSSGGSLQNQTATTATFSAASAGSYTIMATSKANNANTATITIAVTNLAGVATYHNDLSRDGSNSQEYALTTSNVTASSFGRLFSCTVDGAIYAQPLWVPNLNIGGVTRNVVFVATQHDSLYAFDADANPCVQLWTVSLIDAAHGGTAGETSVPSGPGGLVGGGYGDITPEAGITGTPVIDLNTKTLYAVSKSVASGNAFYQRLHGIDLLTGNEKLNGNKPVLITGVYPGTGDGRTIVTFSPKQQNQRPGLALVNGTIYIAWSSHEDNPPYYGWVMSYDATTLAQKSVLNVTPNVGYGGIWMGGGAPAADSSNNLYLLTGNGTFDVTNAAVPNNDYGDSFLKISPSLSVLSYFTPSDESSDNANDTDFGSGGAAILVDLPNGTPNHFVIGGGKDGSLYLLNRDSMGGLGDSNALQLLSFPASIFSTGAFWNNSFYLAGVGSSLYAYTFNPATRQFTVAPSSQSGASFGFPGSTPSVSSQGTLNGIVWALDNGNYCTPQSGNCGPTILHALDATNLANELWNSSQSGADTAGNAVKFTVPTVANGKVYVGTRGNNTGGVFGSTSKSGELDVYGLKPN